jgi:hypothetical protein
MTEVDIVEFAKKRFSTGDTVCFNGKGGLVVGIIAKINKKTISVRPDSSMDETKLVPPQNLRLIARA